MHTLIYYLNKLCLYSKNLKTGVMGTNKDKKMKHNSDIGIAHSFTHDII